MAKIISLRPIESIKLGPDSAVLPDGTIENPVPYLAADVVFDDGVMVQVERPLTLVKISLARQAATKPPSMTLDDVSVGDPVVP